MTMVVDWAKLVSRFLPVFKINHTYRPPHKWNYQSISPWRGVCTSSSLDLLIDKQLSTQTKETWEGHRITILCAVRLPTGQTGVKFSWMHIPSNRTVSKQFHEELRGKSYLTITTLKDEDFESMQCRAETASTVKFHVIDIIKLSEYIDWFYWKTRGASRSGLSFGR